METFSALLAVCEENSPVTDEFPSQRPVMQSAGDLRRHRAHYDVTVMNVVHFCCILNGLELAEFVYIHQA